MRENQNGKIKYFIDFDDTLFDRGRFAPDLFSIVKKYGFDDAEIEGSYKVVYSDGYEGIWAHLSYLNKNVRSFDIDKAGRQIESFLNRSCDYLFPEALPFLEKIDRKTFDVRLLTVGGLDFQKLKVVKCGIEKYFDQCHFTSVNKAAALVDLVTPKEQFILLDDKEREVLAVRSVFPQSIALQAEKGRLLKYLNPVLNDYQTVH